MSRNYYTEYPGDEGEALEPERLDDFGNEKGTHTMGDDPLLEAPTAPKGLRSEPVAVVALVLIAIQAAMSVILDGGAFKDGVQVEDFVLMGSTAIGAVLLRMSVFSQDTVDKLAPRSKQREVVKH